MTQPANTDGTRSRAPQMARIESLGSLVGAHPDALRDYFASGAASDSTELRGALRGRVLGFDALSEAHVLTRPLVRALSRHLMPWQGKLFESGGTAGADRVFGLALLRFRCEVEPSLLDDRPALVLHYDDLDNPWPFDRLRAELRRVGDGIHIGPALAETAAGPRTLLWWGLQTG